MPVETIGQLPPIYFLAYVVFGTFFALMLYHLIAHEKLQPGGERTFGWILLALLWGGSGAMVYITA